MKIKAQRTLDMDAPPPAKPPKRKATPCRHLTPDEDQRILQVAQRKKGFLNHRNYLYYLLGRKLGYRVSETLSLRVRHLWVDGSVVQAVHVDKACMKKQRDRRPVPLQPDVRQEVLTYLQALAEYCGSTLATLPAETPIFLSRKTRARKTQPKILRAMSRQQAYTVMQAFYAAAQVSRHDGKALANRTLRKTFAMRVYEGTQH